MRKIAANCIYLPDFPFVRNGYVILDGGSVLDVVDTGGTIREIPGLEFYGGMIVDAGLSGIALRHLAGEDIIAFLDRAYKKDTSPGDGIAILLRADLTELRFTEFSAIERIR